ncbi:VOC family protein [Dyadobacter sp. Leaf189]|uniref:VOC family protein n=1 Tax=Dyadobacter sp. Leaf189 TaxID=1736295 RepID=UPI0006F38175|nr:VOC family protein [Dyadobacter sp. Leaf189]KQS30972.1 glyoxalase [Dyadobacter sp. Leaf189]
MKIEMVSVFVNDVVKAHQFYTEKLGFVEKMFVPEAYLAIVASSDQPDGTSILLEPNQNPIASTYQTSLWEANLPVITFSTSNIYQEYEKLSAAGVVFRKAPVKTEWGYEAIFEDTCGNLIQLAAF